MKVATFSRSISGSELYLPCMKVMALEEILIQNTTKKFRQVVIKHAEKQNNNYV